MTKSSSEFDTCTVCHYSEVYSVKRIQKRQKKAAVQIIAHVLIHRIERGWGWGGIWPLLGWSWTELNEKRGDLDSLGSTMSGGLLSLSMSRAHIVVVLF